MTDNLPVFSWGESVTWSQGRLLVPLNRDNETVADLELSETQAGEIVDHLLDPLPDPEPPPAVDDPATPGGLAS